MSSEDLRYFEYNPKWQTSTNKTPSQERCKVSYVIQQNEIRPLTEEQQTAILTTIQRVINEEVYLDLAKNHNLNITILEKDQFSITIDNQTKFFISKQGVGENKKILAIQDELEKQTVLSFLTDFWKMILNLFYTPSFPVPFLKERSPQDAILQDYRGLRKTLESGKNWLVSKEIKVTSDKQKKRELLTNQVTDAIANAKKIEEALRQKDPSAALKRLASEWARELLINREDDRMVIPVGYLNSEGVMQPMMLRFYQNKTQNICLEIYCDHTDGAAKITPTQIREITQQSPSTLEGVLEECFQPLIIKNFDKALLEKVTAPNAFFKKTVEEKISESLVERGIKEPRQKKSERVPIAEESPPPKAHTTYESIIRALDVKMGDNWNPPEEEAVEKVIRQPLTPASRVVKWFDHLIAQENGHLTANEKLNLLFRLTNTWVQDQIKQVNKNTPLIKQLEVYEQCVGHIEHMIEKVAVSINQGHPVDTPGIPDSLKNKKMEYLEKIESIREKLRKETVEATGLFEDEVHSEIIEGVSVRGLEARPTPIAGKPLGESQFVFSFDEAKWDHAWQDLSSLLKPEKLQQLQAQQSIVNLVDVIQKTIAKIESENGNVDILKEFLEAAMKDPVNLIMTENGINPKLLAALLLDTGYADAILTDKTILSLFKVSPETFVHLLSEFIACPFFLPHYRESGSLDALYKVFFSLIRKILDPSTSADLDKKPAHEALRALLQIGQVIPKDKMEKFARE
ncbi:MAG TPA: hypothetical protein VIH61_00100, partial [Waddliaceae bacterium]